MASARMSYWKIFRIIFVIFSLYLLGDVFYRWDGFKYYASFAEFIPNVALITVLWSCVAIFAALIVWLSFRTSEWFFMHIGLKVKLEHLLIFACFAVLIGIVMWWKGRQIILSYFGLTLQIKLIVFLCVIMLAIIFTWIVRYRTEQLNKIIQTRITPLVWLFGIFFILSVPIVGYNLWVKQEHNNVLQSAAQSTVINIDDNSRPNIILIIFDAMTARDMSAYGYHKQTTPFISEWVKTASLFKRLQAASNFTTPTVASLMTGKRLWTHQLYTPHGHKPIKGDIENLALVLKNNGYFNMALVANLYASVVKFDIAGSFDIAPSPAVFNMPHSLIGVTDKLIYRLFADKFLLYDWIIKRDFILFRLLRLLSRDVFETVVPPEKVFNEFLSIIEDNAQEPFFAWIHLYPPHDPYLPPPPYMGMFDLSPELRTFKSQVKAMKSAEKSQLKFQQFPQEVQPYVNLLKARYDEYIRYCDKQFEDFFRQLEAKNKLKNTVVILSSDHGESFEHNYIRHGKTHLYEQVTNIPLIIKEPDQSEGRIIDDLAEQIDIPATILELANIPVPSWLEGQSLVPFMHGIRFSSKPVFSMALWDNPRGHQITNGTIAVWEGNYKLIHYLKENKSLLFNLREDPDEMNNLFDKEPEIGKHLLVLIKENLKKANKRISREK